MFTGIIEEIGTIVSINDKNSNSKEFVISIENMFDDIEIGDSISVNGVCLTVTKIDNQEINFDIINETLEKSNLGSLSIGSDMNLERSLSLSSRFNGHILQGHVEAVGVIVDYKKSKKEVIMSVGIDPGLLVYCIPKGSIAFDGISLTISKILRDGFQIVVIPQTLKLTNLIYLKKKGVVNVEFDILGKYIKNLLKWKK